MDATVTESFLCLDGSSARFRRFPVTDGLVVDRHANPGADVDSNPNAAGASDADAGS